MDAEITRWRTLASSLVYTHPEQRTKLVGRPKKPIKHQPKTRWDTPPRHKDSKPIGPFLDKLEHEQRADVTAMASGHMNPNHLNQQLYEKSEKQRIQFGKMDQMLEEMKLYDPLNKPQTIQLETETKRTVTPPKKTHQFVQSYHLNLLKKDQLKAVKRIDNEIVDHAAQYLTMQDSTKESKLKKYYTQIQQELEQLQCPPKGPDPKRLQVYSDVFDQREYDATVSSFATNEQELEHLQENDRIKQELKRKLALYASYLPAQLIQEKQITDPLLKEIDAQIKPHLEAEDPITHAEAMIAALGEQLKMSKQEIERLLVLQQTEFVPKITREKIEENLNQVEQRLKFHTERNLELEKELLESQQECRQLESNLREREQQYQFLMSEYNDLLTQKKGQL
ncbi:hypothetical protein EDD86DRAFT_250059 [Gorgonomyces haynaldii]|nr:hypothetical protein EDD86DRAFT_250059 [Gorgonomyces haynaldii]